MGSDLYNHLIKYFVGHLKSIREVRCLRIHPVALTPSQHAETLQDEALLKYYAEEWDRYTTGANYINRLFTYLNRHWVKRERDEGRKGVYPVYIVRIGLHHTCLTHRIFCLSSPLCNGKTTFSSPSKPRRRE